MNEKGKKITRENHEKTMEDAEKKNHNGDNIINSAILAKWLATKRLQREQKKRSATIHLFIHSYCNLLNGCEFSYSRSEQYIFICAWTIHAYERVCDGCICHTLHRLNTEKKEKNWIMRNNSGDFKWVQYVMHIWHSASIIGRYVYVYASNG